MEVTKVRLSEGGWIVIPAEYRRQLGLDVGDDVLLQLDGQELRLFSRRQGIRRAQELVRRAIPPGRSLVDELIAERRREAEDE
jgi:bifunctional DNA-binding transcriptional regulator/antitoxin component of YhaV-PrlF toxin-antitoxin module